MVWLTDESSYRTKMNISRWKDLLCKKFVRIHRSYLVNRKVITGYTSDTVIIGDEELPISRKYRDCAENLSKLHKHEEIN